MTQTCGFLIHAGGTVWIRVWVSSDFYSAITVMRLHKKKWDYKKCGFWDSQDPLE